VTRFCVVAFALLTLMLPLPGVAASFSFTGNFVQDDDVQFFSFTLNAPSTVAVRTYSYAGGTNAAGQSIAPGGFDPNVSIFDSTGIIDSQNDAGCPAVNADPVTGACWDSLWIPLSPLPAGSYIVALSQSGNFAVEPTLADGFTRDGQGNFTGPLFLGAPGAFLDQNQNQRTPAWALDILDVDSAVMVGIPEPATAGLFASACAILLLFRRGRSRFQ
jgi:hypothetical protein